MLAQLLYRIRAYLDGSCTLDDLEIWLISNLERILLSGNEEAVRIANELDADLIWLQEGLITQEEFRTHLKRLLEPAPASSSNLTFFAFSNWAVSSSSKLSPPTGEFKMMEAKEVLRCSASPAAVTA